MTRQTPWQREESRIYLRDIFFLGLIVLFSVFIAEGFLLQPDATIVDRIFGYLLIFIPLGTVNLIAHLYYRNRRIRLTGSLRSSLRYRLSLAFMIVSVIPSIPIFFISSNMVERLVDIFFGLDVAAAFVSADKAIDYYRGREQDVFAADARRLRPDLWEKPSASDEFRRSLFASGLVGQKDGLFAVVEGDKVVITSRPVFPGREPPVFRRVGGVEERGEIRSDAGDYALLRFPTAVPGEMLVIGRRFSDGLDSNLREFDSVRQKLSTESGWRHTVPSTLRLGLGLIYVGMICMALLIAIVIARQISGPIVSLAAAVREVADGHLDTRLDVKASGELGILIDSFNQMTQELQSLRGNLLHSQRVAAWQEVARRLAHEIKNPLTPIQLSADRMLRRLDHPEKGRLLEIVKSSATTISQQVSVLKHMVEEFADFARMPAARPVAESLDTIVSEAVNLFHGIPGISIEMHLAGNLPQLSLDKNIIIGLINNLVKNAVEAIESQTRDGEKKPPKIIVSTSLQKAGPRRYVILKVEDSGPGIDDGMKDRIFEPYFSTKGDHGSGLGLALVERAVLEHDARIFTGRSSILGGAEFRIMFRVRENEDLYR